VGLRDWLRRGKQTGPRVVGTSKGGSRLLKYGDQKSAGSTLGFTEESTLELTEAREKAYEQMFGEPESVYHEMLPLVPHIDVYRYSPSENRRFYTLVTGGMSDLPMNSPEALGSECRRAELVFYASEGRDEYQELLRCLAHFPHDNNTWLHWGHTMPNGSPPEPLFGSRSLNSFFFMASIVRPDSELGQSLVFQGDPVHLVWCVPVSSAECELKLEHGADALYDLFDRRDHPFVFTGDRRSYV
jgi:hypothetical protein